jgi:serine/threonine protein kinase
MNLDALKEQASAIQRAKTPEELFGVPCTSLAVLFRRMAAAVHPDRFSAEPAASKLAQEAFTRLGALHTEAEERKRLGIYGTKTAAPAPKPAFAPIAIKIGRQMIEVQRELCKGDVCDIYAGCFTTDTGHCNAVIKIAQHPSDNDLVENEAATLKALNAKAEGHNHARYLPTLLASFTLRSPTTKSNRRVNVLPLYTEHVSLAQIIAAHPNYIDFRDATWMLKRMLEGLGFVHGQGFVHGAVLPEHVLVHPLEHGAKLIGWGCSAPIGKGFVRAISSDYRHWYPPEILSKSPATPASDIYLWARTGLALVGHRDPPARFRAFLEGCLVQAPSRRPSDAWALRDEFSELLQKLVGPPSYRPFKMPEVVK